MPTTPTTEPATPTVEDRSLALLIHISDQLIRATTSDILASEGLHRGEYRAMRKLAAGRALGYGSAWQVRRLAQRGWVVRGSRGWMLTREGAEVSDRIATALGGVEQQIADALTPERSAATADALADVVTAFGGDEAVRELRAERRRRRMSRRAHHLAERDGNGRGPDHDGPHDEHGAHRRDHRHGHPDRGGNPHGAHRRDARAAGPHGAHHGESCTSARHGDGMRHRGDAHRSHGERRGRVRIHDAACDRRHEGHRAH